MGNHNQTFLETSNGHLVAIDSIESLLFHYDESESIIITTKNGTEIADCPDKGWGRKDCLNRLKKYKEVLSNEKKTQGRETKS